eukprot:COSAG01_NODE_5749_length_4060_cov_2.425398_1_plen_420_part_00
MSRLFLSRNIEGGNGAAGLMLAAAEGTLAAWAPPGAATHSCAAGAGADSAGGRFNAMLAPVLRLAIRGVVYAGGMEDLVAGTAPSTYAACFAQTVNAWRDSSQIGDFAVVFTQLAGTAVDGAAALRLAQARGLPRAFSAPHAIDTTAMASRYDTANTTEVARRLALGMVHAAYSKQEPNWGWSSPVLEGARVVSDSGGGGGDGHRLLIPSTGGAEGDLVTPSSSSADSQSAAVVLLSFASTEVAGEPQLFDRPGCVTCCSGGGGALVQALAAAAPGGGARQRWHNASSLEWVRQPLAPVPALAMGSASRPRRRRAVRLLLRARFDGLPTRPVAVRIAAGEEQPDCFLRNANGWPVLPGTVNASTSASNAAHPQIRSSEPAGVADVRNEPFAHRFADNSTSVSPPPMGFNTCVHTAMLSS